MSTRTQNSSLVYSAVTTLFLTLLSAPVAALQGSSLGDIVGGAAMLFLLLAVVFDGLHSAFEAQNAAAGTPEFSRGRETDASPAAAEEAMNSQLRMLQEQHEEFEDDA